MKKMLLLLLLMSFFFTLDLKSQKDVFVNKKNTVSNVEFSASNYGTVFLATNIMDKEYDDHNILNNCFWPRNSGNEYIFGAGFWLCAKKRLHDTSATLTKLVLQSYDPNSAKSSFVPGRIEDGDTLIKEKNNLYQPYLSTAFDDEGNPETPDYNYNWPLWTKNNRDDYSGTYILDPDKRNRNYYPEPEYLSDEVIFNTYKDTDLRYNNYYEHPENAEHYGYPFGI